MAKEQIRFDLDSELKRQFQMKCVERGEKMTPVLHSLLEEWINHESNTDAIKDFLQSLMQEQRPANSTIVRTAGILKLDTDDLLDFCDHILSQKRKPNGCNHTG
jgi:Glu-tRNA(Gln) amidotransferase subunit E-like FAD-binding protein